MICLKYAKTYHENQVKNPISNYVNIEGQGHNLEQSIPKRAYKHIDLHGV